MQRSVTTLSFARDPTFQECVVGDDEAACLLRGCTTHKRFLSGLMHTSRERRRLKRSKIPFPDN